MKSIKYLTILFVLGILFVSCDKPTQEQEWNKHYGYTNSELIGSYSYSKVADAFDGLTENAYMHICEDAIINIVADSDKSIQFDMRSVKNGLNLSLVGPTALNPDDFLIKYVDGLYELTAYVYTNTSGQIRLHGFVRTYSPSLVNYYFDVIKN